MTDYNFISFFIAPILAVLIIIYFNYRFQLKTNVFLLKAVLFGLLSVGFVVIAQLLAELFDLDNLRNLKRSVFYTFVVIGFSAELGKFIFLRYVFLPKRTFNGPLDGIIYSVLIALGFSTIACVLMKYHVFGTGVNNLYLYFYALANVAFAIIMGFFVGLGKARQNRFVDSMTGLFAASFLHGLFNFSFMTSDKRLLLFFGIGLFVIACMFAMKAVRMKNDNRAIDQKR
jgi:protease PrsW